MSLMSGLYVGASGLQTSQNALNTTAHNLMNAGTAGYTRQQISLTDRVYNNLSTNPNLISKKQTGLGVTYALVKQTRDQFLDQSYRRESGRSAFYEVSYEAMTQVETVLGELNNSSFNNSMEDLWEAVQELAKNPVSEVNQSLFVQRAASFVENAASIYNALASYQDNLNAQVNTNVTKINEYGKRIVALNDQIRKVECGGVESANDLRDERNRVLDELGRLVNITYSENMDNTVTVKIEGAEFVMLDGINEVQLYTDPATGFYTPYFKNFAKLDASGNLDISGAKLYDLTREISTDANTDVGGLKALVLARGDHRATYKDIPQKPDASDTVKYPGGVADPQYLADMQQYDRDVFKYNENISSSILMNVMSEFDQLVNKVTTTINKVLADGADRATALDPDSTYLRNEDGSYLQVFTTKTADGGYTCGNLQINGELMKTPVLLGFRVPGTNEEDNETINALCKAFTDKLYTLNPNVTTKINFTGYYSSLVSQVANSGAVYKSIAENQIATVQSVENARQSVVGVSSEEELSSMIRFQNAYNASSRYLNAISEMLEHVITTLGA